MKPDAPVLIVEDDRKTADLLAVYLTREGFRTSTAYSGKDALDLAAQNDPLFVILDVMLPDLEGWEVCRQMRKSSAVPIMMLSALGGAHQRVKGLTLGADDYMVKPFSFGELAARVKAILRRAHAASAGRILSQGDLTLDSGKRRVTRGNRPIALTAFEFRLLHTLMSAPGRVFNREELLESLYPSGGVVIDRVVDVHIGKLRQKLADDPSQPAFILTQRGVGYRFTDLAEYPARARASA